MDEKPHVPVTVLEAETVLRFFSSCAMAKSLAEAVGLEPRKWIVWITGMEIDQSSGAALRALHETYTRGFLRIWKQRLTGPNVPKSVKSYLDELDRKRGRNLNRVEAAFGAAHYVTSEMDRMMRSSLRALRYPSVSTLLSKPALRLLAEGSAVLGLGDSAVPLGTKGPGFSSVGLGANMVISVLGEWESAMHAKLLAVSTNADNLVGGDAQGKRPAPKLDKMQAGLQQIAESRPFHEKLVREVREEINEISKVMKRMTDAPKEIEKRKQQRGPMKPPGAAKPDAQDLQKKLTAQRMQSRSMPRVPIVFAAEEIAGVLGEYAERWEQAR
ncbi:MAG: hypothetical protein KJZ84_00565 [Bryobacteraceae bacterium]|nr:hypothetical protein [Bryobacteraceae bacterium]